MKKPPLKIACTTCFTLATRATQAQPSVTRSGILDAGFEVNQGGASMTGPSQPPTDYRYQNGDRQASRPMFTGTEAMGGGLKVLSRLETLLETRFDPGAGDVLRERWFMEMNG